VADRAVTPVVSKALEVGLVVLYVSVLTTAMYGTVVPEYRDAAGEEVAERTLATAAERVQQAVPPSAGHAEATVRVDLPDAIAGAAYRIRADGRALVLDHPDGISSRARLALPDRVVRVTGTWESGDETVVRVVTVEDGLVVRLEP
jgi:hypothetical protein